MSDDFIKQAAKEAAEKVAIEHQSEVLVTVAIGDMRYRVHATPVGRIVAVSTTVSRVKEAA
jgi:hypothetical protein